MITVKDIAKVIAAKYELSNVEAEIFMQMIVEVINDGLLQDRQVKIKGFGTFKLQTVKERSSVNVNTGEKVVIAEHDKISFVPDAVMKDLVNKPFAQFDTVIVDDNSPLLDSSANTADGEISEIIDNEKQTEDSVHEALNTADEETSEVEAAQIEPAKALTEATLLSDDTSISKEYQKKENDTENGNITETEDGKIIRGKYEGGGAADAEHACADNRDINNTIVHDECELPVSRCRNIFIYYGIIINIFVAAVAFALGYFACSYGLLTNHEKTESRINREKKSIVKVVRKNRKSASQPVATAVVPQTSDTAKVTTNKETEADDAKKENKEKNQETLLHKYDNDIRVKTGAYYIVGTSKEITVKDGQTITSISRQYLGDGMECYVEAYNGIKSVKKGDKVKIPQLKLKKTFNKK